MEVLISNARSIAGQAGKLTTYSIYSTTIVGKGN